MSKNWEELLQESFNRIREIRYGTLSPDLFAFYKLWKETQDLVRSSMGIPADEYDKVLDQAAKMMESYDPDRTYRQSLVTYEPENAAQYYYKLHPDSTKIVN